MNQIRIVKKEDKEQLKELWKNSFQDSKQFVDWYFENRFIPSYSVCMEKDGEIISAIHSSPVHVILRGKLFPSTIVAGCATKKGYEKKGYMKQLFSYFMNYMREIEIVLAPHTPARLETFFNIGHYPVADAGFFDCEKVTQYNQTLVESNKIVEIKNNELLDNLLLCYQKTAFSYSGMISRSLADFHLKASDYRADGGKCIAHIIDEKIKGYCFYFDTPEFVHMEEFITENEQEEILFIEYGKKLAFGKKLHIKLPYNTKFSNNLKIEPHSVMGLINAQKLLSILGNHLPYTIEITDAIVNKNQGIYDMQGNKTNKSPQIKIESGRFLQWISGYASLKELAQKEQAILLDEQAAYELDKLFPKVPCRIIDEY